MHFLYLPYDTWIKKLYYRRPKIMDEGLVMYDLHDINWYH